MHFGFKTLYTNVLKYNRTIYEIEEDGEEKYIVIYDRQQKCIWKVLLKGVKIV